MSEKSFAVASVSVAIVCGVFFYPPLPKHPSKQVAMTAAVDANSSIPVAAKQVSLSPPTAEAKHTLAQN